MLNAHIGAALAHARLPVGYGNQGIIPAVGRGGIAGLNEGVWNRRHPITGPQSPSRHTRLLMHTDSNERVPLTEYWNKILVPEGEVLYGPNKGMPVDTQRFRVAMLVDPQYMSQLRHDFSLPGDASEYHYVANIAHNDKYYIATILPEAVAKVSFLIEEFFIPLNDVEKKLNFRLPSGATELQVTPIVREALGEVAQDMGLDPNAALAQLADTIPVRDNAIVTGHGMLRFHMHPDKDVQLVDQSGSGDSETVHDLVASIHGNYPTSATWDPLAGLQGAFVSNWGLFTVPEKEEKVIMGYGNTVRQIPLTLPDQSARDSLLLTYLMLAREKGLTDVYNSATNNCGTGLFVAMDRAFGQGYSDEVRTAIVSPGAVLGANYPMAAATALAARNLVARGETVPSDKALLTPEDLVPENRAPTLNAELEQQAEG